MIREVGKILPSALVVNRYSQSQVRNMTQARLVEVSVQNAPAAIYEIDFEKEIAMVFTGCRHFLH